MSGIKFLLDTNFILGLLKSQPVVLEEVALRHLSIAECAYSAITRIELLTLDKHLQSVAQKTEN